MDDTDFLENILKGSSKYNLYDELSNTIAEHESTNRCNVVKQVFPEYNNIYQFCGIFTKNLKMLHTILAGENDYNERCKQFVFWTHYEISKRLSNYPRNTDNEQKIMHRFYTLFNTIKAQSVISRCNYNYRSDLDLTLWKQWKHLYDYIGNYSDIENKIKRDQGLCPKYLDFFNYIEGIYKSYKEDCCNSHVLKCPFHFGSNLWCENDYTLPKYKCDEIKAISGETTEHEVNQVLDESQEGGRSHPATSSTLEVTNATAADTIINNSDYYIKPSIGISLLSLSSIIFYLYK
ncbi:PIR Superfamily Protein, partial [Plasmodium ovale curtisi]